MSSLKDRLIESDSEPGPRVANGVKVSEILRRLELGVPAGELAAALELEAIDILAALAEGGLAAAEGLGPDLVCQAPLRPRLAPALFERALADLFPDSRREARLALSAGLLQIHDFWGPSHDAAQSSEELGERLFSAYWHGIAHRREPDAGNASYWFRRVGCHPIFANLAASARPILEAHGDVGLTSRLLGQGAWNSSAMIDLCTEARPGTARASLARRLQRLEMQLLLDATVAAVLPS